MPSVQINIETQNKTNKKQNRQNKQLPAMWIVGTRLRSPMQCQGQINNIKLTHKKLSMAYFSEPINTLF